jgi:hypothetical protein
MKLDNPKNQYALAIRLLIENHKTGMTMLTAMKDYFHKFNTRLPEIERSLSSDGSQRAFNLKIRRLPVTTKNRFGHKCTYTNYKSLATLPYLINLYNKLNRQGLKK